MRNRTRRRCNRRGAALVLAVLAMTLLMVTGGALLTLGYQNRTYQVRTASDIVARCAADAALSKALYEVNAAFSSGQMDNLPQEMEVTLDGCNATFSYTITQNGSDYTINGTGQSNGAQRTVQADLVLSNPFDFAVFCQENLGMKNSSLIDWYNNKLGDAPMKIGTNSSKNSAIDLKNSTTINGDVIVGVGGNPDEVVEKKNGTVITGDIYAQTTEVTPPKVSVPPSIQSMPSMGKIQNSTVITTSGKYDEINLGNSKKITVKGNVELYITGDIKLGNSSEIEIDSSNPDSSLTIYLAGNFDAKNSSNVNNKLQVPRKLQLLGLDTCTSIDLKNSSELYAVIYAPEADVVLHNSADIYGSFTGKNLELRNSGKVFYDASLRETTSDDKVVSLKIRRWKE